MKKVLYLFCLLSLCLPASSRAEGFLSTDASFKLAGTVKFSGADTSDNPLKRTAPTDTLGTRNKSGNCFPSNKSTGSCIVPDGGCPSGYTLRNAVSGRWSKGCYPNKNCPSGKTCIRLSTEGVFPVIRRCQGDSYDANGQECF